MLRRLNDQHVAVVLRGDIHDRIVVKEDRAAEFPDHFLGQDPNLGKPGVRPRHDLGGKRLLPKVARRYLARHALGDVSGGKRLSDLPEKIIRRRDRIDVPIAAIDRFHDRLFHRLIAFVEGDRGQTGVNGFFLQELGDDAAHFRGKRGQFLSPHRHHGLKALRRSAWNRSTPSAPPALIKPRSLSARSA